MLKKIVEFLERRAGQPAPTENDIPYDRMQVAAAALMVEASRLDSDYDMNERATIGRLLRERFTLGAEETEDLIKLAEHRQEEVYSDWMFTDAIKTGFSIEERHELIGMLWQTAYSDGALHHFESHMIKRVADELEVSESACEAARKGALARLGMSDPRG